MIQPQNLRILIAEDEVDLRELLAARFKVYGFQIFEAAGGDDAYTVFEEQAKAKAPIDTVVTDVRMPRGSGLDLLKKLKLINPASPKVFLVSAADGLSQKDLYALGAEGFLEKPYDTRVLIEMIRKSMLSNKERWRMPPNFSVEANLELKLSNFKEAEKNQQIGLGRGGFFIKTSSLLPQVGQAVKFKISASPLELSGVALLKWQHKSEGADFFAGFEFVHLNGPGADDIYKWIEDTARIAYIPKP